MSSCVRLPVIHGAAVNSSSSVQRSPMPFARLPCACVCALTRPGWINLRSADTTVASSGAGRSGGPISAIVSSWIRMSRGSAVPASMSSTRPPRMIVWAMNSLPGSDLAHRRGILCHARIGRQQRNAFDDALCQEQPVEWISMQWREICDSNGVLPGDWQLLIAVIQQIAPEQCRIDREIGAFEPALNGYLPQAGRADDQLILQIVDQTPRLWGQARRRAGRP